MYQSVTVRIVVEVGRRGGSVSSEGVRVGGLVHADDLRGDREVALVVRGGGRGVVVVVPAVTVLAEPVEVLHAQVQTLHSTSSSLHFSLFILYF